MREVFADACYWIALLNSNDSWNRSATKASENLNATRIVSSDAVLNEFMDFYSKLGKAFRRGASELFYSLRDDVNVRLVRHNQDFLTSAAKLYADREDKGYSLTDCVSFVIMKDSKIVDALTHDKHFTQEVFQILMNDK